MICMFIHISNVNIHAISPNFHINPPENFLKPHLHRFAKHWRILRWVQELHATTYF